jgi:hypothetical protein
MICRSKRRGEKQGRGVSSKPFSAIAGRKLIATILNVYECLHVTPLDSSLLDVSINSAELLVDDHGLAQA